MAKATKKSVRKPAEKKPKAGHFPFKDGTYTTPDGLEWEVREVEKKTGRIGSGNGRRAMTIRHECKSVCIKMGKDGHCLKWKTECHQVN